MQRFLVARRPPTALERLLGRRRARRLRRRVGLAAVGTGLVLLRPKRMVPAVAAACGVAIALTVAVAVALTVAVAVAATP
jgi:hypothetical protein